MGASWETCFLPVTIVSCNTLLIHYYTKILQTGHFVSQTSPQEKHLQKKWSIPQRSQWKLLQDGNKNNIWRHILWGVAALNGRFGDILKKSQKCPYCDAIYDPRMCFRIFFLFLSRSIFHCLHCGILYLFSRWCAWGEICKTKWLFWRISV